MEGAHASAKAEALAFDVKPKGQVQFLINGAWGWGNACPAERQQEPRCRGMKVRCLVWSTMKQMGLEG